MRTRLTYLFDQARHDPAADGYAVLFGLGLALLVWSYRHPDDLMTGGLAAAGVLVLWLVADYVNGLTPPRCWCGERHWEDDEDDSDDEGPTEYGKAA